MSLNCDWPSSTTPFWSLLKREALPRKTYRVGHNRSSFVDYGTELDSVDEISKFLQASAIRDRNGNPLN